MMGLRASRRAALTLGAAAAALALPGCALPARMPAVPKGQASTATVLGVPNERFFVTEPAGQRALQTEFWEAGERLKASRGDRRDAPLPDLDLLGVSGGGDNGAFGAGVLNGWTQLGTRPEFFLVTGVSTGALTAPFAFLGSAYDPQLKAVYTDITFADVAEQRTLLLAFTEATAFIRKSTLLKLQITTVTSGTSFSIMSSSGAGRVYGCDRRACERNGKRASELHSGAERGGRGRDRNTPKALSTASSMSKYRYCANRPARTIRGISGVFSA